MKTVIITRLPLQSKLGGEELHTLGVALFLREQGYQVVFATSCKILNAMAKEHGFKKYPLNNFPASPTSKISLLFFILTLPFSLLGAMFEMLVWRLAYGKFTLYCLNLGDKLLFGFWARVFGIKAVFLEHATIGSWLTKNPLKRLLKWNLASSKCQMVTVSHTMKQILEQTLGVACAEIKNGIELDKNLNISQINAFRNPKQILFVGRQQYDKGFDIFLEIAKQNPDLEFVAIGSGSLKKESQEIPNLKNLGPIEHSELKKWYRQSQMLLLPTTTIDPFGLVVAEAMNQGCVPMCSNLVGATDYLDNKFVCHIEKFKFSFKQYYQNSLNLNQEAYKQSLQFDDKQMFQDYLRLLNAL